MSNTDNTVIRNVEWVMARHSRSHGLLPIQTVLKKYGDPQDQLKVIHVAGTNGKGSTVNYLLDILVALGYKTGTFTSPHLEHHCDRIRINGQWIPEERFNAYVEEMKDDIEELDLGMFEIDTLIALRWFLEQKVDYAILECGIGGRLDNTNVMKKPALSIITTIGYDHVKMLGSRIEQIAFEKAGIIMPYTSCAVGFLLPKAENIIRHTAYARHGAVSSAKRWYREKGLHEFVYRNHVYTVQGAAYQKRNAALALHAAWLLGLDIGSEKVKEAVAVSQWKGRFETVSKNPLIVIDGAHNEEGVRALCASAAALPKPLRIVFSALRDKPGRKMAQMLKDSCERLYITHFEFYRADTLDGLSVNGAEIVEDWQEAIRKAVAYSVEGSTLITGSLYFISDVREYLLNASENA
ncbi:MAG: bifunctional folylpolyglutamate synthase/dihydrofolate synthase [Solobacterium sp.]|nr:bifunctional folylpolyglutamate synthase/dihydrofolate synthase [Solobacterium sp.]